MLTVTSEAAEAINALVADQPGAGLRISSESIDGDHITLGLAVTDTPAPTDQVIEEHGSHVFVDNQAATLLNDKILDAQITDDREVAFSLFP